MVKFKSILLIGATAVALSACSIVSKTPSMDAEISGSTYGLGGSAVPGGTAQVSLGATNIRAVIQPTVVTDKDGNQEAFIVDAPCGRKNVPSIWGTSAGNANAAITGGAPGVSMGANEGMAVGEAAIIGAMTGLQNAAGPNQNVLAEYENCSASAPK